MNWLILTTSPGPVPWSWHPLDSATDLLHLQVDRSGQRWTFKSSLYSAKPRIRGTFPRLPPFTLLFSTKSYYSPRILFSDRSGPVFFSYSSDFKLFITENLKCPWKWREQCNKSVYSCPASTTTNSWSILFPSDIWISLTNWSLHSSYGCGLASAEHPQLTRDCPFLIQPNGPITFVVAILFPHNVNSIASNSPIRTCAMEFLNPSEGIYVWSLWLSSYRIQAIMIFLELNSNIHFPSQLLRHL